MLKYLIFFLMIIAPGWADDFTEKEQVILSTGEITKSEHIVGSLLGIYPGFGLGHAVQDRWSSKGYIFTVGEFASLGVLSLGVVSCVGSSLQTNPDDQEMSCNNALVVIGAIGFLGFKIWEIVDVWVTPAVHNRQYRKLKARESAKASSSVNIIPLYAPNWGQGLALNWSF